MNSFTVVIPAAGRGKRLRPFTKDVPKCLVEVGGVPVIERQLAALPYDKIRKLVVVVGSKKAKVFEYFNRHNYPFSVSFLENEIYQETNCAYSVVKALPLVNGDFLYINCDLLFSTPACERIINDQRGDAVIGTLPATVGEYDFFQTRVINDRIIEWATSTKEKFDSYAIGPIYFRQKATKILQDHIKAITDYEKLKKMACFSLFGQLIDRIHFVESNMEDGRWVEIDTAEDLMGANKLWA